MTSVAIHDELALLLARAYVRLVTGEHADDPLDVPADESGHVRVVDTERRPAWRSTSTPSSNGSGE